MGLYRDRAGGAGGLYGRRRRPGPGGGGPGPGQGGGPFGGLPAAAQAAAGKCFNILENFNNVQLAHSMSIIETLNNYISTGVIQDGEFKAAMRHWSACMAKQRFNSPDANTFSRQAEIMLGQRTAPGQNLTGPPRSRHHGAAKPSPRHS